MSITYKTLGHGGLALAALSLAGLAADSYAKVLEPLGEDKFDS